MHGGVERKQLKDSEIGMMKKIGFRWRRNYVNSHTGESERLFSTSIKTRITKQQHLFRKLIGENIIKILMGSHKLPKLT